MSFAAGFLNGAADSMNARKDREVRQRELSAMEAIGQQRPAQRGVGMPADVMEGVGPAQEAQAAPRRAARVSRPRQSQQEFIDTLMPHALRVSERTGIDPRLVIAQAAQETGWGRSAPGNNYFGIKSHGREGGATHGTHEYVNGQRVNISDSFRQYDDPGQSADDYAHFLQSNPRYRNMLAAGDLDGQLAALGRSGYATDPNYSASVGRIARGITVPQRENASTPSAAPDRAQNTDTEPTAWRWANRYMQNRGGR
ncbi:glycoside hydrolase family 73 protein [Roseicitreum antarcticum]|uniref:Flagellum-specific peptidoglycan hydrolase FlgJ n=1 Tax=Roseicitreum antarcticum TaxID=564137 RepID=A0A1H3E6D9_9RHOB|nr:glucosaminidase domain-containing protein [Roseicitreum antarcticum]SDX74180.1 Flagellum-specific peptidoglycan hydrolase FlgJ [Roseicitreum antarcticum]